MTFQMQAIVEKPAKVRKIRIEKNEVKSVVIIRDRMIKHLNGWNMSKKAHKSECKIYVKQFPGAKTSCMKD